VLFGYDIGVISGAILFIKKDFSLSPSLEEIVVSSVWTRLAWVEIKEDAAARGVINSPLNSP
jgi:hypothetical protein